MTAIPAPALGLVARLAPAHHMVLPGVAGTGTANPVLFAWLYLTD